MTAGLKMARARCAASSSAGNVSPSDCSKSQAASRAIGSAPAFSNPAKAADFAFGNEIAMLLSFTFSF
jgi:hypothetical protein